MAGSFKVGDVVVLKSGGPEITITDVRRDNEGKAVVWTSWFEG